MYESRYETKPYRDRRDSPAISIYVIDSNQSHMDKISCIHCKRTIYDIAGTIDTMITIPMPVVDFGLAVNIQCKLCKQQYRLLINGKS